MKRYDKAAAALCGGVTAYIVIYVINSVCGGYWPYAAAGRYSWGGVMPIHSAFLWQPYFGYVDKYNTSPAGYVFYPMILCDQRWAHPTLDLFKDESLIFPGTNACRVKWHPIGVRKAEEEKKQASLRIERMARDPQYCLEQVVSAHGFETHLIAMVLFDKYGIQSIRLLADKMHVAQSEREVLGYYRTIEEIGRLSKQYYNEIKPYNRLYASTNASNPAWEIQDDTNILRNLNVR
jgi:hypothetical protein